MIKGLVIAAAVAATLPDPKLTPGRTDPRVTQANIATTICAPGYTKKVRPPVSVTNKIKKRVMLDYHAPGPAANYELDHLISLELGGSPDAVENLWPEKWEWAGAAKGTGAEAKDYVEYWLHKKVCAGRITLAEAQRRIATNWMTAMLPTVAVDGGTP